MDTSREDKLAAARKKLNNFRKKRLPPRNDSNDNEYDTRQQSVGAQSQESVTSPIIKPPSPSQRSTKGNQSPTQDSVKLTSPTPSHVSATNRKSEDHAVTQARTSPTLVQDPQTVIENLIQDRKDLTDTIDRLADALHALASEKAELQQEVNRLTSDLNVQFELQEQQSSRESQRLQDLQAKFVEVNSRVLTLEELNGELERGHLECRSRMEYAELKLNEANEKLQDSQRDIERLRETVEVASHNNQDQALTKHVNQLELQISERDHQILQLTEKKKTSNREISILQEQLKKNGEETLQWKSKAEDSLTQSKHLEETYNTLKTHLDHQVQQNETLKSQYDASVSDLTLKLEGANDTISQLRDELSRTQLDLDKRKESANHLFTANERISGLLTDNKLLVDQLEEMRSRCIELSNERARLIQKLDVASMPSKSQPGFDQQQTYQHEVASKQVSISSQTPHSPVKGQVESQTETTPASQVTELPSQDRNVPLVKDERSSPDRTQEPQSLTLKEFESKIQRLEEEKAALKRDLEQEQKLTTLLTAEVETLPDYIQIYHRERKALISQMQAVLERLKQEGIEYHPAFDGSNVASSPKMSSLVGESSHTPSESPVTRIVEATPPTPTDLVTVYNGAKKGAVQGLLLQDQLSSVIQGCRLCHGSPIITL